MSEVIRRNHFDVTNRVFVGNPRIVCEEVCAILRRRSDAINAGPLRVILGLEPANAEVQAEARPSGYKRKTYPGAVDLRHYVPT